MDMVLSFKIQDFAMSGCTAQTRYVASWDKRTHRRNTKQRVERVKKHTVLDATRGYAYGRLGQWPGNNETRRNYRR